jgi:hypothetical protein
MSSWSAASAGTASKVKTTLMIGSAMGTLFGQDPAAIT